MPHLPFELLPETARVWAFAAERPLSAHEEARFLGVVDGFLEEWAAHGTPLSAGRDWKFGRFLLVGVDESTAPPSGCSIDAMANVLKGLEGELGVGFLDHTPVLFREGGEVRRVSRTEFQKMAAGGDVTMETPVFDNTITRKQQLTGGEWEKPAGTSWHRRAFFT